MAKNTDRNLLNQVIYEVYVRNHSAEGNFLGVQKDLPRIKKLGVDIIWLMPIHPIGRIHRKADLGCPYSIQDYRAVNPEYGTIDDFKGLVAAVHDAGMKLIIDIVFNHTAHDSRLFNHHPEWFYQDSRGVYSRKVADWTDIVDLDFNNPELREYLTETLGYWVKLGVDGFRCDVASLVPIEFWLQAQQQLQNAKSDLIWVAESSDPEFIFCMRRNGFNSLSDGELYQAFDLTYDYDVYHTFQAYLRGEVPLEFYLSLLRQQEIIFPANYIKLRFLENHDQPRIKALLSFKEQLLQWTAFAYFEKGTILLYGGQETTDTKTPSLFGKDTVNWDSIDTEFCQFISRLANIKKEPCFSQGYYQIHQIAQSGVILASYQYRRQLLYGIFNVEGKTGFLNINCRDGFYRNLIDQATIVIREGMLELQAAPIIFYSPQDSLIL